MTDQTTETGQSTETDRRIVVGVDGSTGSKKALIWALAQAYLTGATIEAVTAWQNPMAYDYGMGFGWASPVLDGSEDMASLAQKNLDATVADVYEHVERPVTILTRAIEGHPAEVLMDAAVGAQGLVVGTRGHGTFAGILLGSVSQHCVQHATCPVTVIPE